VLHLRCGRLVRAAGAVLDSHRMKWVSLTVNAMAESATRQITKADVDRFLFGKHLASCPVCGRFRTQCNTDVHTLSCQGAIDADDCSPSVPIKVLMIVCQNCGAIQFHDRAIIAQWLDCQHKAVVA